MRAVKRLTLLSLILVATLSVSCGDDTKTSTPTSPAPTQPAAPRLTAPTLDTPQDDEQLGTLRPTLFVKNGTSDQSGVRTYEFQISDSTDFSAAAPMLETAFKVIVSKTGVAEDSSGKTGFTVDQDLQPTTRLYWRARMVQGSTTSDWSVTGKFRTKLVGYLRAGELYDPLIHGETVGQIVGSATFIPGKGIRLENGQSHVRYLLPQTISDGEFSMDVEGLAPNLPGDKTKVFGMQEGQGDFVTNLWRVDAQYRGAQGVPPNCIQWRAMFGGDDHKIEPDTAVRWASVYLLDPTHAYHWRSTWGPSMQGFRLEVFDGPPTGAPFYNQWAETSAIYRPNPHYAYLGAPVGRSGGESASIGGTIYRNVWLGNKPRPRSLGSALLPPER